LRKITEIDFTGSTREVNRVQYLGYIIDEHGVHVDPTKIQVIHDWPADPDFMRRTK